MSATGQQVVVDSTFVAARPDVLAPAHGAPNVRVASVDAYRGLVMFLILAEVFRSCEVSAALSGSGFWRFVCQQQSHAAWTGCNLHDLIQPSFYFLVGVGLLFSMRRRLSSGQSFRALAQHTITRSLILIVLGLALVAVHPRHWRWWFDDTLTQIGLAYPFLFLIAVRPRRDWCVAFSVILVGYWAWFAMYPLPPPDFDYASLGIPAEWLNAHRLSGFAAHWQIATNASGAFDRWFVNLFPQDTVFVGELNGLTTLNFIPSIGTMILGLFACDILRSPRSPSAKARVFCLAGVVLIASGWFLGAIGVCPVVKAIWTPSWVLFGGGWCFLLLAMFYVPVDILGYRRAAYPLIVIGTNSVVAYTISHVYPAFAFNSLRRAFGSGPFQALGQAYEPAVYGCVVVLLYWLALYLLYRRRIFVRI